MKSIHPWQSPPKKWEYCYSELSSVITVVIPVFNQEINIIKTLNCLSESASLGYDLILIDDGPNDNTLCVLKNYCEGKGQDRVGFKNLRQCIVLSNEYPIFETACDNLGFRLSRTEYILELQADIYLRHKGFDRMMFSALNSLNLSAVSGRLVHDFSLLDGRKSWLKYPIKKTKDFFGL